MSKLHRSLLVGGPAVMGAFLTFSGLLVYPQSLPVKSPDLILPKPAYTHIMASKENLLHELGIDTTKSKLKVEQTITSQVAEVKTQLPEISSIGESSQPVPQPVPQPKPMQQQVQIASRSSSGTAYNGMLSYALSLQGVPYMYGGTTEKGFDCSGYTSYVFGKFGISLPRTSYDQFKIGLAVKKLDLQPGDLVFFTTYDSGASHSGIYIGNNEFIHAAMEGIKVDSITGYYASRFLGGRRI